MNDIILNILKLCLEAHSIGIRLSFDCNDIMVNIWLFDGKGEDARLIERVAAHRDLDNEEHSLIEIKNYLEELINNVAKNKGGSNT